MAAESTQHGLVSNVASEDLSIQGNSLTEDLTGISDCGTSLDPSDSLSVARLVTDHLLLLEYVVFASCAVYVSDFIRHCQVNYQSVLSTYWGSWAFMIGSVIQLWESLWREGPSS